MERKRVSLRRDAYERLKRARRQEHESLSDVILRATWPAGGCTAGELLEAYERHGPFLGEEALDRIEEVKASQAPPGETE